MATGMALSTIGRGLKELAQDDPSERVRRPGAGRKPAIVKDPTLVRGSRGAGRNDDAGGSGIAVAVDLQKRATIGRSAAAAGPPGEPHPGGGIAQCDGLQPARKPQDQGG